MSREEVDVLYIAGVQRSGTTIIGRILGEIEEAFYAGEVKFLPHAYNHEGLCSCSSKVSTCKRWKRVCKNIDINKVQKEIRKNRTRDITLGQQVNPENKKNVYKLYHEIKKESGCSLIVDSSKFPSYLHLLHSTDGIKLRVIHVVRDPRAVSTSWWQRPLENKNADRSFLDRSLSTIKNKNPIRCSLVWLIWNYTISKYCSSRGINTCTIKYESFCKSPNKLLEECTSQLGIKKYIPWEEENSIFLSPGHSVSGNPDKFQDGLVRVRNKSSWRKDTSRFAKYATTLITLPLLIRHGYV